MTKFASAQKAAQKQPTRAAIKTVSQTPDARTYEGGPAFTRDSLSELFLLGVGNFVGEDTFYEKAETRDERFAKLSRTVAVQNPEWFASFVKWLRTDGNMRSAPLVAAAEGVYARLNELQCSADGCEVYGEWVKDGKRFCGAHADSKMTRDATSHKAIITSVLQRADEPGELVAYWTLQHGQTLPGGQTKVQLPKPLKRGIADALVGKDGKPLYTEYSALKYDTDSRVRFGDVLNVVHPDAADETQGDLFGWLLDRRHGRDGDKEYPSLTMVTARKTLQAIPQADREATLAAEGVEDLLKSAGVTWEWLSSWLGTKLNASFWESVIPTLPYMATLRNLRNFDQAGISREAAKSVAERLEDPRQVQRSRQFPYRFLSAYKALDSVTYAPALEAALDLSTQNIPELGGRTLILIDTSGSMTGTPSDKSTMTMMEMAALFGIALAKKGEKVDVYGYADTTFEHKINKGASVLKEVAKFTARANEVGWGTRTAQAVRATYAKHDRVVIFTDGQTFHDYGSDVSSAAPASIPLYAFNLVGYAKGMIPVKKNRYEIGGVTDATFRQIKLLEAGKAGNWPWEDQK